MKILVAALTLVVAAPALAQAADPAQPCECCQKDGKPHACCEEMHAKKDGSAHKEKTDGGGEKEGHHTH